MDGARVTALDVAQFIAAAGGNLEAAGAEASALAVAVAPGDAELNDHGGVAGGAAGEACLRALRSAMDTLGAAGAATVAREAIRSQGVQRRPGRARELGCAPLSWRGYCGRKRWPRGSSGA
eukprot:4047044-Pleurochrysis_carterae.AAC.3